MLGLISLNRINNLGINFVRCSYFSYILSILLIVLSFAFIGMNKFNLGIDFSGGVLFDVRLIEREKIDFHTLEKSLKEFAKSEVVVQAVKNNDNIMIKLGSNHENKENITLLQQKIREILKQEVIFERVEFVGPQIGREIINGGVLSVSLSFLAILIYIGFRFKFSFGISILLTLVHDTIVTFGFISVSNLEFNATTIAAILTVIGYSVNDTVVIFDRIRENISKYKKMPFNEIINISINETLSRTINTVLTTLLAVLALIIFGGESLLSFSATTFFGIVIGTYSSIFLSAPLLLFFNKNNNKL